MGEEFLFTPHFSFCLRVHISPPMRSSTGSLMASQSYALPTPPSLAVAGFISRSHAAVHQVRTRAGQTISYHDSKPSAGDSYVSALGGKVVEPTPQLTLEGGAVRELFKKALASFSRRLPEFVDATQVKLMVGASSPNGTTALEHFSFGP